MEKKNKMAPIHNMTLTEFSIHKIHTNTKRLRNVHLLSEMLDSTSRERCQSSKRLGYSSGSAKDSAAFGLTFRQSTKKTRQTEARVSDHRKKQKKKNEENGEEIQRCCFKKNKKTIGFLIRK